MPNNQIANPTPITHEPINISKTLSKLKDAVVTDESFGNGTFSYTASIQTSIPNTIIPIPIIFTTLLIIAIQIWIGYIALLLPSNQTKDKSFSDCSTTTDRNSSFVELSS